jgi:hypothetical protein
MISGLAACYGQPKQLLEKEHKLRVEMDYWMAPYRNDLIADFDYWLIYVQNHIYDGVLVHPFYKHMQTFFKKHEKEYLQLRQTDLTRYPAAPKELPGYIHAVDFHSYIAEDDKDEETTTYDMLCMIQDISNFRTLGVADTRSATGFIGGIVIDYLIYHKGMGSEQIANLYTFGDKLFADLIKDNLWEITLINRLYSLKYTWNMETNRVSLPVLWIYEGDKQPAEWLKDKHPKASTERQQLFQKVNMMRWAMYDRPEKGDSGEYGVSDKVGIDSLQHLFLQNHRQEYIRLRSHALANLPSPDAKRLDGFKTIDTELKGDFLYALGLPESDLKPTLPIYTAIYEIDGSETVYNFYYMTMLKVKNYAEYTLSSWILGDEKYAKQIDKHIWEIQFFYRNYALRYHWNIASDELSEIEVRKK